MNQEQRRNQMERIRRLEGLLAYAEKTQGEPEMARVVPPEGRIVEVDGKPGDGAKVGPGRHVLTAVRN